MLNNQIQQLLIMFVKTKINLQSNLKLKAISLVYLLYTIIFFTWLNSINFKTLILGLSLLVLFVHIFAYFITIYTYSKLTSAVKYYWIRVFALIWLLEFYIFAVFIFLYLVAPNELQFFWDPLKSAKIQLPGISNVNSYILVLTLVYLLNSYTIYTNNNSTQLHNIILSLISFILVYIFLKEFKAFIYYTHVSNFKKFKITNTVGVNTTNDFLLISNLNNLKSNIIFTKLPELDMRHHIPSIFILNMILSVKFVHVYLIILTTFLFIYYYSTFSKKISMGIISVIQQNLIILLLFWALNYIIFFKVYYKNVMYGMYKTIGVFDLIKTIHWTLHEIYIL